MARGRILHRLHEAGELGGAEAAADAEVQTPVREHVHGGRLLGEKQRIVPGQHGHGGAQPQPGRVPREVREQRQGRGRLAEPGEVVFGEEDACKAERLGLDRIAGEVVVGVLEADSVGLGGWPSEQSETHRPAAFPLRLRRRASRISALAHRCQQPTLARGRPHQ